MMRLRLMAVWTAMLVGWSVESLERPPADEKQTERRLLVNMTLLPHTSSIGAVCLDGSPPAYHLHRGSGAGSSNWLLQFEGGGWCNDLVSCVERSRTRRGSTRYMNKLEVFSGILSNDPNFNPDFYNWNRVKLRYCDGASFAGDSEYTNGTIILHFRGERIWEAIINDLLSKGLINAQKVLLSGCSAGGLATFLHCDDLSRILPDSIIVKCMSDAGFFLDVEDISGNDTISPFFYNLVNLQFHHIFVPPSADLSGHWDPCKSDPAACTPNQISILQGFRLEMLSTLTSFEGSMMEGVFINSCFAHCQSELQGTWFAENSPRIHNKSIAEAVGDWYFGRNITKEVDCPYPCDHTCQNLIP